MAAVASPERVDSSPQLDASSLKRDSDASSDRSSPATLPSTADAQDRSDQDQSISGCSPKRSVEMQSPSASKSEEYRQLFRLPLEEVLVQDFNCASQESILLQGHMYLFTHYICFYSNIFGYETKKIIPFLEVTSVKRAKTAGIFPNAIEIVAGGRKYFFASFLSRDEAFRIINDGWLQQVICARGIIEQQDSISESGSQENGSIAIEKDNSSKQPIDEWDTIERDKDALYPTDPMILPNAENGVLSTPYREINDNVEQDVEPAVCSDPSSSTNAWTWKVENFDPPEMPESYMKLAETKFLIKVEEFFSLFFSDDSVSFNESFHQQCKDQDFRSTSWSLHEDFGYTRDVSFRHPIKLYLGAKLGSCKEVQKFRVYRNSHLLIETSQTINDVPYGDHFSVEVCWDIQRDSDESTEGCALQIYVDVKFTKKTIWKGKIVQSTQDECREVYALWITMAHEFLKRRNLGRREEVDLAVNMIQNGEVNSEGELKTRESLERVQDSIENIRRRRLSDSMDVSRQAGGFMLRNPNNTTPISSLLSEHVKKFCSYLKCQSPVSLILVIAFAVIILMQVSILVLLNRPQNVHVASPVEYMYGLSGGSGERSAEALAWLERRMHHLKDEMFMVEARLERMRLEHASLKAHMKDLDLRRRR
ncbi:protein VASCULAR ASSOCIATED DEATH 1 chloroplastic isoform X2 [Tripterygium wilfordii]|uniref:Protein VASCULAR ASSOCIATED DEATH 1 chloroplastic isoform X2 n=1 Tax=Tripterygium wilfordii TaxID=458696 RepID=A0A7J7CFF9_TRIWF|nr:protein VASCULAR ASSOCIATED DEATH 1, chloroplastic-like [Tripterygium wilfordii]KAF5732869.1 protein VASCULAR ASSOCIATED DEATH 1 chloroplastic isoform X2 [Tripterygium wilfordii]